MGLRDSLYNKKKLLMLINHGEFRYQWCLEPIDDSKVHFLSHNKSFFAVEALSDVNVLNYFIDDINDIPFLFNECMQKLNNEKPFLSLGKDEIFFSIKELAPNLICQKISHLSSRDRFECRLGEEEIEHGAINNEIKSLVRSNQTVWSKDILTKFDSVISKILAGRNTFFYKTKLNNFLIYTDDIRNMRRLGLLLYSESAMDSISLLTYSQAKAKERGYTYECFVSEENRSSLEFHKRLGFKESLDKIRAFVYN